MHSINYAVPMLLHGSFFLFTGTASNSRNRDGQRIANYNFY
mgnify:CR=1 FL=1